MNTVAVGFPNGFWVIGNATGDPQADLLTGQTAIGLHDQEFGGGNTGRRWKLYRPFIQDDWRVSKNLTLNLGLAWAMATPESEVGNRQSDFNPATGTFLIAGQNAGPSAGIQMDWTALEPRLGAAWKPFGRSNTVVRGGYAIFHDSSWNMGAQGLWQNPPYYAESFEAGANMSAGFVTFPSPPNPADFEGTILSQNTNFKQGRVQQFNINVEQELPGQVVLTAGYAGSRSFPHSGIRQQHQRGISRRLWNGGWIYGGMRSGGCGLWYTLSRVPVFGNRQHFRRGARPLQFASDQGRD